jgi:glycosyltransferase involved in cell wall biosynthesis
VRIGIAGPILTAPFAERLGLSNSSKVPEGLGGTPVVTLVQGLLDRGRNVTVFTLDPNVSREVVLEGDGLRLCIGPFRVRHRARDFFAVEREYLQAAMLREKPDVVHANWTYEFADAALSTGLPVLVTAHDAPLRILRLMPDSYRLVRFGMAFRVAQRTKNMTAVSEYVADHFKRKLFYRGEMAVIPNAIGDNTFAIGRPRSSAKQKTIFATVLTGWSRVKNGEGALRAFRDIRAVAPGSEMWMFGPGYGQGEGAWKWASAHNLAEGVRFMGTVPHRALLAALAENADILIHPSREDAAPVAVAEAMSLGITVVGGAKTGGVPELLERGKCGLLVDIESPVEISRAALRLIEDKELFQRMSEAGRQAAQGRFTVCAVAGQYEHLLERLN